MTRAGRSADEPPNLTVTLLYVPADRPDRVRKAFGSTADVVIIDLEDAVAPARKDRARESLPAMLADYEAAPRIQVRVNAEHSPWGGADLAMASTLPPGVEVRLPKVDSAAVVRAAVDKLGALRRVHCLIESALGVENAFEIAAATDAVGSISIGEADLHSDIGSSDDRALDWARGRVINAACAAELPPPSQSVYPRLDDPEGLAATSRAGRRLGFVGRCAIHPAQLSVIRDAYRPEPGEVEQALAALDAIAGAMTAGSGVVTVGGRFVDQAMVVAARRVLALDAATAGKDASAPT